MRTNSITPWILWLFLGLSTQPLGATCIEDSEAAVAESARSDPSHARAEEDDEEVRSRRLASGPTHSERMENGRQIIRDQIPILRDPVAHLGNGRPELLLTPNERDGLIESAVEVLLMNGPTAKNANHIADHLAAIRDGKMYKALVAAGLDPKEAELRVVLHDLGKEFSAMPEKFADYKYFMENVFKKPNDPNARDVNQTNREIMAHEIASMLFIEQLARENNIAPEKIARLKALIAGHNAGYDPKLEGNHFWIKQWEKFVAEMEANGVEGLPTTYRKIASIQDGNDPHTIILTAVDRATSMTLASQEKFSDFLRNFNNWNNEALAKQMEGTATNVEAEVKSVLEQLNGPTPNGGSYDDIKQAIPAFFAEDQGRLLKLGTELRQMGNGEGRYSNRPPTSESELKDSIIYRTNAGKWVRITRDGKLFDGAPVSRLPGAPLEWKLNTGTEATIAMQYTPEAALFRLYIYPDQNNYRPRALERIRPN